jgi:hypothetical protein
MRVLLFAAPIVAGILLSNNVIAEPNQLARPATMVPTGIAPIGHVQPEARSFSPNSSANEVEQERLSRADARQQQRDEALDSKLSICRGC